MTEAGGVEGREWRVVWARAPERLTRFAFAGGQGGGVGFRLSGVERAAGPKAAVDEHAEAVPAENEVGLCAKFLQLQTLNFPLERSSSPPTGVTVGAEESDERLRGGGVAVRAEVGHHGGMFFLAEAIGHGGAQRLGSTQ